MAAPRLPAPAPCVAEDLRQVGLAAGLDAVGFTDTAPLLDTRAELHRRIAAGLHDTMAFTYRNPERSTSPDRLLRSARSLVVGARSYLVAEPDEVPPLAARVARYAWNDQYAELRAALNVVADALRAKGWRAAVYADDNAVVDRAVAQRAGLGWYGKNANLLLPKAGSWFVLGCVATDAPIESDATPVRDGCGACTRCFAGCPTDAIPEAGVIDASRCLAWLLQKPGVFPRRFRRALGSRIYGCDDCQEVCPVNERFATARRDDEVAGGAFVSVLELLALDDEALRRRNGQWYLFERDPRWLRRNALIVLGNLLADDAGEGVASADRVAAEARLAAAVADPDPIVRAHAIWAARRAGFDHLVPDQDLDPVVAAELVEGDGVESVDVIPTRRQWERR